jgi:hypothetical protein
MQPNSYSGLLGAISEQSDIALELGVSFGEAQKIQEERAAERLREYEAAKEPEPSNVIQFRPRGA